VVRFIGRSWSSVPGFARILLVVQGIVIVGLSAWIYNEYVNNQYLQSYLFRLFDGQGAMLAILGIGGVVATALVGILLKAGDVLGEIEDLSENVQARTDEPTTTVEKSTQMPILRIVKREPNTEIGRFHGSLRRWKERSSSTE
jgi:hypothetical protein